MTPSCKWPIRGFINKYIFLSLNICLVFANDVMEHFAFPGNIEFAADDKAHFDVFILFIDRL